jgi:hypothetical protein
MQAGKYGSNYDACRGIYYATDGGTTPRHIVINWQNTIRKNQY